MFNNNLYKFFLLACVVFCAALSTKAATCISLGNGDWSTGANWSCGSVPTCGDSVVILAAHTITITSQQDYSGCPSGPNIVIYGVLKFDNGNKLKLPCDARVYIMPGGSIEPGTGGGNSNYIELCDDIVWNAASGDLEGPSCLPANSTWCIGTVLPVELVDFTGEAKDGYVDLSWITATENNSCCFEIERSPDAASFSKFNSVNSKSINGYSHSLLSYNASDDSPISNISYYRLKQIDKDNNFTYSSIISVNYIKAKNIKFVVYPNPNKGEFTADISGIENNHEVTISLRNEKGRSVYHSSFYIQDAGSNKLQIIPENKLSSGIYLCILTIEDIQYLVKVVVS